MIADIDNLIEINLRLIAETKGNKLFRINFIDLCGKKLRDSERLAKIMESKRLIDYDHIKGYKCELTEFGLDVFNNGGWLKYLDAQRKKDSQEIVNREKIEKLNSSKLAYEYKLSKWKVKTFWPVFGFGLIGFISGIYNFIDNRKTGKYIELQEKTNRQMESELSKLHTLILDQKSLDSLHISKILADSLNKK